MSNDIMARHVERYGEILTTALKLGEGGYDENQCRACPHEHRCCSMLVSLSPFEAIGIITWLKVNLPGEAKAILDRVKMRAEAMLEFIKTSKPGNIAKLAETWYARNIKCVFYDQAHKRCSIYPVRPVACRMAYGRGDCTLDGVRTVEEDEPLRMRREHRVRLAHLSAAGFGQGELCATITMLRTTTQGLTMAPQDQHLLATDPALLPDDVILWGLDGPPVENPVAEV